MDYDDGTVTEATVHDTTSDQGGANGSTEAPAPMAPDQVELLKRLRRTILEDKEHHKPAFERMRRWMKLARFGCDSKEWDPKLNYTANIIGRHIAQKTNALYAKNPKAVSQRRETLDFQVWDETPSSLSLAYSTLQGLQQAGQQAQAMASGALPSIGPDGHPLPVPQAPPGYQQAMQVLQDFQQGMARRENVKKIGKTLEILFAQSMREQKPLNFKAAMKRVVRRACTAGVGYVKVGFQRETGPRMGLNEQLADAQERLAHLQALAADLGDEDQTDPEAEAEQAELENMIADLQNEPETVRREGLVFDYPLATRVIPDKATRSLVGFVGSGHVTLEFLYTKQQIQEIFGVEIDGFTRYASDTSQGENGAEAEPRQLSIKFDKDDQGAARDKQYALVWEHYDKPSGLVYYFCDGCEFWLREPAAPDVVVDDFWPVYPVTFNETDSEDEIFPLSDVHLLEHMNKEYNRSREGKRQHRQMAIPRFVTLEGVLAEEDQTALAGAKPFTVTTVQGGPDADVRKLLGVIPVPGVDPNLYDVNEIMADMQYVVGAQSASMGGTSKATATESAIAASASASTDSSSVDELDEFLTNVVRASGQVLMGNMSEDRVIAVVGPGAVWPQQSMQDIAEALFLEIEAGSSGKPNQAIEIQNWTNMLPFLLQMQAIDPVWLARESLRRLDDKMDLTEAIAEGAQSAVAANRLATAQPPGGPPGGTPTDPTRPGMAHPPAGPPAQYDPGQMSGVPEAQGGHGANNGPAPPGGPAGTGPAFGSNQV